MEFTREKTTIEILTETMNDIDAERKFTNDKGVIIKALKEARGCVKITERTRYLIEDYLRSQIYDSSRYKRVYKKANRKI